MSEASTPPYVAFHLIIGSGTDAVLPPDLVDGAARVGFFQHRHNLGLGELRLAHGNLLAKVAILPGSFPLRPSQFVGSLQWGGLPVRSKNSLAYLKQ